MAITRRDGTVEFVGKVLCEPYQGSHFLMSDYGIGTYTRVWNGSAIETVLVGVADCGSDYRDRVEVDATVEVLHAVEMFEQAQRDAREARLQAEQAARIVKGAAVVVVRGRKVAKGTKGVVAWMGNNGYGTSVGLAIEGKSGLTFTAIGNVERDHSSDAAARELDAAHDSALWYAANVFTPKALISASSIAKGSKVTPKSGVYAGQLCRVIWTGARDGAARVGVVPAKKGRFNADWLALAEVA